MHAGMDTSTLIVADITQSLDMVELRPQAFIVNDSEYTEVMVASNFPVRVLRVRPPPIPVIIVFE